MKSKIKIVLISVIVLVVAIIGALYIKSNREFYKDIEAVKNEGKLIYAKTPSYSYGFGYTVSGIYGIPSGSRFEFYRGNKLIYSYDNFPPYREGVDY